MLIIPAVDIKEGRCVRLYRGKADRETVYSHDPVAMARRWEEAGASFLHLVDLDGAFRGKPVNDTAIITIIENVGIPAEVGGGIRSPAAIEKYLSAGAERVIIGSKAAESCDFLAELYREFGHRILPSIDAEDGSVVVKGWVEKTDLRAAALGRDLKKIGFKMVIHTDIKTDGTLRGPNLEEIEYFLDETGLRTIAAGGISRREDIFELKKLEPKGLSGAITGKAIYSGSLDLEDAIRISR